jgi:hypothetical protein
MQSQQRRFQLSQKPDPGEIGSVWGIHPRLAAEQWESGESLKMFQIQVFRAMESIKGELRS